MTRIFALSLAVFSICSFFGPVFAQSPQTPSSTETNPKFKVLEGKWEGHSDTNRVALEIGLFDGDTPSSYKYFFQGRPVELKRMTVEMKGAEPYLVVEGTTGLVIKLAYDGKKYLSGKAKPTGTTQEYDIWFEKRK